VALEAVARFRLPARVGEVRVPDAADAGCIAVFGTIAATATGAIAGPAASEGIANAFLAAAVVASAAGLIALVALPKASRFLPKLRLHPQAMPIH
jgi:hypothetical protein